MNTETDQTLIDAIKKARDILDKPKPYPSALDRAVEQTRLPDMNDANQNATLHAGKTELRHWEALRQLLASETPLSNPPAIHCQAIQRDKTTH